jgi:hypothetical protein
VNATQLANDEANFYRSPFIALCLTIGPAIGFVTWISCEWLLDSPLSKAPPVSLLARGESWFWAYMFGLVFLIPAVVIFVVIGIAIKYAGFASMLVSAVLSLLLVLGVSYISGDLRSVPDWALVRLLVFMVTPIVAMTSCWFLAGAVRAAR